MVMSNPPYLLMDLCNRRRRKEEGEIETLDLESGLGN
jgi:hypothetical protein